MMGVAERWLGEVGLPGGGCCRLCSHHQTIEEKVSCHYFLIMYLIALSMPPK